MDIESVLKGLLLETGRSLHLTAGSRVFRGYLVGFKPPEYLVIEVPRSGEIDAVLRDGHSVVGLFTASGTVVRFESQIAAYLKKPAWLLFLKYPSSLEKIRDLRSSNRLECSIPCVLVTMFNLQEYSGLIADINTDGCKCILTTISRYQTEMFNSEKKVLLDFDLADGHDRRKLSGEVLNVKREGAKVSLGVKFRDNDEAALAGLGATRIDF